jgi:hypothetical protein
MIFVNVPIGISPARSWAASEGHRTPRKAEDGLHRFATWLGVGALQILLDPGNDEDWFATIVVLAIVAAISLAVFASGNSPTRIRSSTCGWHRTSLLARWRWWWRIRRSSASASRCRCGCSETLGYQRSAGFATAPIIPVGAADAVRGRVRQPPTCGSPVTPSWRC